LTGFHDLRAGTGRPTPILEEFSVASYPHPRDVAARLAWIRAKNEPQPTGTFRDGVIEDVEPEVAAKVVEPPKRKTPKGVEGVKTK
jgi:hypothetical protein